MIQYPVRLERDPDTPEVHIRDASNRIIAAHLVGIVAQEIVEALNAHHDQGAQPRKKSKKVQIEDALRLSDLGAQIVERDDIEYGHFDSLPRGEHVARLKTRQEQG